MDPQKTRIQFMTSKSIDHIGPYKILEQIGAGGMGEVYKAYHQKLERMVAIKFMLKFHHATVKQQQRFIQEAKLTARLKHPNIVSVYDVGSVDNIDYIVMDYIEGESLKDAIKSLRIPPRKTLEIVLQVARAVAYSHQQGIIHRDLKPDNIMLVKSSTKAVVMDFGLAKNVQQAQKRTRTGEILGTPQYMAPEQAKGRRNITGSVDVYSLGAILYEMLTGLPTVTGSTPMSILYNIIHSDIIAPRQHRPEIAREIEIICMKALEKNPQRRYSMQEMGTDIERFLNGQEILARPHHFGYRLSKKIMRNKTKALLLLMLCVLVVGMLWTQQRKQKTDRYQIKYEFVNSQQTLQKFYLYRDTLKRALQNIFRIRTTRQLMESQIRLVRGFLRNKEYGEARAGLTHSSLAEETWQQHRQNLIQIANARRQRKNAVDKIVNYQQKQNIPIHKEITIVLREIRNLEKKLAQRQAKLQKDYQKLMAAGLDNLPLLQAPLSTGLPTYCRQLFAYVAYLRVAMTDLQNYRIRPLMLKQIRRIDFPQPHCSTQKPSWRFACLKKLPNKIVIWDMHKQQSFLTIPSKSPFMSNCAFGNGHFVSVSAAGGVLVGDLQRKQFRPYRELFVSKEKLQKNLPLALCFDSHRNELLYQSQHKLRVLKLSNLQRVKLAAVAEKIQCLPFVAADRLGNSWRSFVEFSNDGKLLALRREYGFAIYRRKSWQLVAEHTQTYPNHLHGALSFHPQRAEIAVAYGDKIILHRNINSQRALSLEKGQFIGRHKCPIHYLCWSPHRDMIISISQDEQLSLWHPEYLSKIYSFRCDHPMAAKLREADTGYILGVWGKNQFVEYRLEAMVTECLQLDVPIKVAGTNTKKDLELAMYPSTYPSTWRHAEITQGLCISPNKKYVACYLHPNLVLWDLEQKQAQILPQGFAPLQYHKPVVTFNHDSSLVMCRMKNKFCIWSAKKKDLVGTIEKSYATSFHEFSVMWHPQKNIVFATDELLPQNSVQQRPGYKIIWIKVPTKFVLGDIHHDSIIAIFDGIKNLRIEKIEEKTLQRKVIAKRNFRVRSCVFVKEHQLAIGSSSGHLILWDWKNDSILFNKRVAFTSIIRIFYDKISDSYIFTTQQGFYFFRIINDPQKNYPMEIFPGMIKAGPAISVDLHNIVIATPDYKLLVYDFGKQQ